MKETRRLLLSKWQTFWHFSVVPFILFTPIMSAIAIFQIELSGTYSGVRTTEEHFNSGWPWLIPAIIFAVIQYRRLNLKEIEASLSADEFKQTFKAVGKEMNWQIESLTSDIIIAKTGFSWASWGERITIIRDKNFILINSICDPDNRPSISSWGRNRRNINAIVKAIKLAPNTVFKL
jgi:hypothetical protein